MCLFIDKNSHKVKNGWYTAHTLKRPIIVVKGLCRTYDNGEALWVAPYMGTKYEFAKLIVADRFKENHYGSHSASIENGLHALRNEAHFLGHFGKPSDWHDTMQNRPDNKTFREGDDYPFPAVIPAGAKIWVGTDGDIATDKMTVYRDMVQLIAYHRAVGDAIDVKTAY